MCTSVTVTNEIQLAAKKVRRRRREEKEEKEKKQVEAATVLHGSTGIASTFAFTLAQWHKSEYVRCFILRNHRMDEL